MWFKMYSKNNATLKFNLLKTLIDWVITKLRMRKLFTIQLFKENTFISYILSQVKTNETFDETPYTS
jgi:hypothetical protein